jgi:two-component system cell cycle sensor histidine kinase/response regulator CckA
MMEVATPVKEGGPAFGIGAPVVLGSAASGVLFWRRPACWLVTGLLLSGSAVTAYLQWADVPGLAGLLPAFLALLAVGAFAFAAWTAGKLAGRDRAANMMSAAASVAPEADLLIAGDGRLIHVDSRFGRFFFLLGELSEPLDSIARALSGDADSSAAFARLRASAASGRPDTAEVRIDADRAEWRRLSVSPIPGEFGAALWRVADITARRDAETARQQREEMLADVLDHLPVGFFSADADGAILSMNQVLADWLGLSADEIEQKGRKFSDYVVSVDRSEPLPDGLAEDEGMLALYGPDLHGKVTLHGRSRGGRRGETFSAYLIQSQRVDDHGEFLYSRSVVLRDLLPAQAANAANAQRRERHWLFEDAPVGIAMLDLDGNVTEANRAFFKLLGLHHDAVVGRPLADRIAKEDRDDVAAQLSKVVMGTSRAAHLDVQMPAPHQGEIVASVYASRIEDENEEVIGLILHFIDATEQKHLELQFAQSQKIQAVGQLAGGVAHDFNNLLTAMIGFCDLLLERHGPEDPSFEELMHIKQNANRATNLVRQLLAFSRKQKLQPVLMDVNESLLDMSNLLRRLLGENLELNMEPGRDLSLVKADPGQFDQIIINLAVNARDAMPGGGTVTIRTSSVILDRSVERGAELMPPGGYILIEVIDTGSGIAKENLERIFEPFFSTKEVGAGTGLGLSTVYGIVHQSGGFIFVDSAPGHGTTFSIYLPDYDGASGAEAVPGHGRAAPVADADLTGTGTVLLVEDEDAVRLFGARALRNKGYRVLEASNGERALDVINGNDEQIDLIVSDMVMPGMDGQTLVRLVRHELPDVKVILMSGYTEDLYAEEISRDPSIHFLPKPFTLKGLAGKVKDVLGR